MSSHTERAHGHQQALGRTASYTCTDQMNEALGPSLYSDFSLKTKSFPT